MAAIHNGNLVYPYSNNSRYVHIPLEDETAIMEGTISYYHPYLIPNSYTSVDIGLSDETMIINGEAYDDHWPNYEQNLQLQERMGRVNIGSSDETMIIHGEAYDDHWPNYSHSYNHPTYEENLELQERMGRVNVGLSDKTIMGHVTITSYDTTSKRVDEEADICVICQGEYEEDELIGGLQCRHEYHVECIKKWLRQHNSCPICKAAAVSLSPNCYKF